MLTLVWGQMFAILARTGGFFGNGYTQAPGSLPQDYERQFKNIGEDGTKFFKPANWKAHQDGCVDEVCHEAAGIGG